MSIRRGILIPSAIVWLGLVCAATLMIAAWVSQTGGTSGGISAHGVVSVTGSGVSDPPWTSGTDDPPWT